MDGHNRTKIPTTEPEAKRQRSTVIDDGADGAAGDDDVLAWLLTEECESQGELFNLLDHDSHTLSSTVEKVRFINDPYSSLLVFQSSSSYITINGNEESCGSSFSDSGTSVMASVDMRSCNFTRSLVTVEERRASASSEEAAREDGSVSGCGDGMDLGDGFDWNDEVLARFLGEDEAFLSQV